MTQNISIEEMATEVRLVFLERKAFTENLAEICKKDPRRYDELARKLARLPGLEAAAEFMERAAAGASDGQN